MKKLSRLRGSFFFCRELSKTKNSTAYAILSGRAVYFSGTMTRPTMSHLTKTPARLLTIAITIALLTGALGCTALKNVRYMARGTASPARFHEVVPMIRQDKMLFLDVVIRGRKARFLFDTGAVTVVSPQLAAELGLSPLYSSGVRDSNHKKERLDYVQLNDLRIGRVRFDEVLAAVAPLDIVPEIACWQIDGILGANCMRLADWLLDFEAGVIELAHSDSTWLHGRKFPHTLGFTTSRQGSPYIDITLGKDTLRALLDTGSGITLSIPEKYYDKHMHAPTRRSVGIRSVGIFGTGLQADTTISFLPDTLRIAERLNLSMITETAPKANIGLPVFTHFQVILNWREKQIRLRQIEEPQLGNRHSFGLGISLIEGALRVVSLVEGGPAARAGLRLGDELLAVGEWAVGSSLQESLCTYRTSEWPDSIEIRYRREGIEHMALLQKESYW